MVVGFTVPITTNVVSSNPAAGGVFCPSKCGSRRMVIGSIPTTTKVVISNPVHGDVYSIKHYVIKFVHDL